MNVFYSRLGKYIFALFNDTKNKHHFWVCRSTPLWLNVGKNQYHHHKVWIFKIFPKRNLSSKCVFLKVKNCKKKFQTFQRKFWKALLIYNAIGGWVLSRGYVSRAWVVCITFFYWMKIDSGRRRRGRQRERMWAPAESDCLQRLQRQIQSKQKGQHTNIHNKDTFVNPTTNLIRELIYLCRENRTISIFIK